VTRDELLKLFAEQCDEAATLMAAAKKSQAEYEAATKADRQAWEAIQSSRRARDVTMHRILEVSMGNADPGPYEEKP
jgi:hypothetical protein